MPPTYHVGQRVSFASALCTVRFIGEVKGTTGEWLGVEWDDPTKGKHDGQYKGERYFKCTSTSESAASFVRPGRRADPEQSFVEAVHQKYSTGVTSQPLTVALDKEIEISGKVVEEVGFDKIRRQLAQLHELKIVIVDGLGIKSAETKSLLIREVCPKIVELDLSRNLFESFEDVVKICGELDNLRSLRLNGNRFGVDIKNAASCEKELTGINELEMDLTLFSWDTICAVTHHFRESLTKLTASSNNLGMLFNPLSTANLSTLTLEYNEFTCLSNLEPLTFLDSLETLLLKGNKISRIVLAKHEHAPIFGRKLQYVDLSYNKVTDWAFIDDLVDVFPGLEGLRFSHNPLYKPVSKEFGSAMSADDGYMLTLARVGNLKTLNFSNITTAERTNAEMFYLSRIGKAMAAVPENEEHIVISQHKRYAELCKTYGTPVVVRRTAEYINPDFLEARLIKFTFYMSPRTQGSQNEVITKDREIPKAFDIYRVKGIVGRMFGLPPLSLRLIWETGEWDPVAGYDDLEEDCDEEDKEDELRDRKAAAGKEKGRMMKREEEIEDGTRQVGFCVDGLEATVRIEIR